MKTVGLIFYPFLVVILSLGCSGTDKKTVERVKSYIDPDQTFDESWIDEATIIFVGEVRNFSIDIYGQFGFFVKRILKGKIALQQFPARMPEKKEKGFRSSYETHKDYLVFMKPNIHSWETLQDPTQNINNLCINQEKFILESDFVAVIEIMPKARKIQRKPEKPEAKTNETKQNWGEYK